MDTDVLRFAGSGKPSNAAKQLGSDFRIVQRWGTAAKPVRQLPEFDPGQPVEGILGTNGEWWAVCEDSAGRLLVLADPFSLQPLFYAPVWTRDGSDLLVGSALNSVAKAMHLLGAVIETDWSAVLPSLTARRDFFDTMWDVTTPVRRLFISRPDQAILIEPGSYTLVPRPSAPADPGRGYHDLLRSGVDSAIAEIQAVIASNGPRKPTLNLSGGKDSRLVLAMLLAAGVADQVEISGADPRRAEPKWRHDILTDDLRISSQLVGRYGLTWTQSFREREVWPDSLDGQLAEFQLYRGGRSYQFFPHSHSYRFVEPEVRITGAGAGVLKSPWLSGWKKSGLWQRMGHTSESFPSDIMSILRSELGKTVLPANVRSRALNRFFATMRDMSDGTPDGAAMAHYTAFRNRGHVGGMMWAQSMGIVYCNPLLQTQFHQAVHQLTPEARDSGRITFDLLEMLMPEMNDLEFQSGAWPWEVGRPPKLDWSKYGSGESRYFHERDNRSPANSAEVSLGSRPDMTPLIRRGLGDLRDALDTADYSGAELVGGLQDELPSDLRGQGRLLTRLASWAHSMPDPGALSGSADPRAPRIFSIHPADTYRPSLSLGGAR